MDEFDAGIHRTLVDYLTRTKQLELAAVMLDGELHSRIGQDDFGRAWFDGFFIDIPAHAHPLLEANEQAKVTLTTVVQQVAAGHTVGEVEIPADCRVSFRMKLLPVEEGWQNTARSLLLNPKGANQALVSDLASDGRPLHRWNELRYASASEIRVAQELERRKVLFFPLAVGVRAETGKNWQDHREVDFLVCDNGVWGILEVAYHPNRYEQDAEKDMWFKKSGILCVQHFTAERCYNEAAKVVAEFLALLAQHKK